MMFVSLSGMMTSCKKNVSSNNVESISKPCPQQIIPKEQLRVDTDLVNAKLQKTWTFDYKHNNFPCDTLGGCIVKGFAVEADSTFYILGGTPVSIARYHGTELLSKKELDLDFSSSHEALLHVSGDSIYFVDEQAHILYSLDKELNSQAISYSLPLSPIDSIVYGRMEQDDFILVTQQNIADGMDSLRFTTWCFTYPNILQKQYLGESSLYTRIAGYYPLPDNMNDYFFYQGLINEYRIFLTPPEYDKCSLIITNESGKCICNDTLHLPPIAAASGAEENYGWLQSDNLRAISNNKLYLTGYDVQNHHFLIVAYYFSHK